jgi:hypothetical protein
MVFSGRVESTESSGNVRFTQQVGVVGRWACETLFLAKHPHKILRGPICEKI